MSVISDLLSPPGLLIRIYGMPAPQGSKSFKGMSKGKDGRKPHAILVESSKQVAPWRQDVVAATRWAIDHNPGLFQYPIDAPVSLTMVFTWPKPETAPKRRRTWPDKKPDLSKLCRSTEDALVTAGLLKDDARIVGYDRLWKTYPREDPDALDSPGCLILVRLVK